LRRHRQQTEAESRWSCVAGASNSSTSLYDCRDAHCVVRSARKIKTLGLRLVQRRRTGHADGAAAGRVKNQLVVRLQLQLDERNPLRVLDRGYAICTDAEGMCCGRGSGGHRAEVNVQLARGRIGAEVRRRDIPKHKSNLRFSAHSVSLCKAFQD